MDLAVTIGLVILIILIVDTILALVALPFVIYFVKSTIIQKPWQVFLIIAAFVAAIPAVWYYYTQVQIGLCIEQNGVHDLSCAGEIAGAFVMMAQIGMIVFAPIVAWFFARLIKRRYWKEA